MPLDDPDLAYRDAAVAPHVRFDETAATQLLAQLHVLRDSVTALAANEQHLADAAVVDWDGFTRGWFNDKHKELSTASSSCRAALDAAIAGLRQAIDRASNLQRVWDGLYLQWRAAVATTPPGQPKPPPPRYPNP